MQKADRRAVFDAETKRRIFEAHTGKLWYPKGIRTLARDYECSERCIKWILKEQLQLKLKTDFTKAGRKQCQKRTNFRAGW